MRRKFDRDSAVHRPLRLADRGEDARTVFRAINRRLKEEGRRKRIGTRGPLNRRKLRVALEALGLLGVKVKHRGFLTRRAQEILRDPSKRTAAQKKRSLAGGGKLRERAWAEMQKLIDAKVTEQGGNNRGRMVEEIIRSNGGVPGEPWCGDTVAYCYLKAGAKSVVRAWAAVRFLEKLLTRVLKPKRGHVVIYSFDHTGLFDRWAPEVGPGYFYAGEGNTGNAGAVSDSITGGDGVKLKLRNRSQVSSFRRVLR